MSQFKSIYSLGTTSVHMAAVRLKSANKQIFRALLSLSSAALLTRMAGMLNQVVASSRFVAGATMDAYFAPFMYPVLALMVMVGLLECFFNVEGQFGWPAYAGLLVPLATAALVIVAGRAQGVVVLCTGMVLGLCLQLGVSMIRAKRAK